MFWIAPGYYSEKAMAPHSSTLPGKSHGWGSLEGCSPWGPWGSDTTEWLHFHFWLSCIGEGNGNPLQCSCLENPRDRVAWWAAVYGVAQSQTRLKRLSSSSSSSSSRYCWETIRPHTWPGLGKCSEESEKVWMPCLCLNSRFCTGRKLSEL